MYHPILVFLAKPPIMKKLFVAIILVLSVLPVKIEGQYYDTGQDPASLHWNQIITPHFKIIYPTTFSARAQYYARLLEESYKKVSPLYPGAGANIPVIIHNYSMESNGYVSWAPGRMELFPLPGQDNLPGDPAEQLVIHETTHVLQMRSLQHGLSRFLSYLAGEQVYGLSAVLIPDWAFEGDAVYVETALTSSGRGRDNSFLQEARALTLSPGGLYKYDKLLLGSYKNFTPDHYVFGYLMMNYLRNKDPEAWSKTIFRSGSRLADVNRGLRLSSGFSEEGLYNATFQALKDEWECNDSCSKVDYSVLTPPARNDYINYYSPFRIDNNRIVSLKTSLSSPPAFVLTDVNNIKEEKLSTTGYIYPYFFSYSSGTIVWAELHSDPRWDNLDYSVIKKMSVSDGLVTKLTSRTRYTAPDLSPDGETIVAVSSSPQLKHSLVFLSARDGVKLAELSPDDDIIIERPQWSSDGKAVTYVSLNKNGEGIRTYFPAGKRTVINRSESNVDIVQAKMVNDTVYYLAQGDGSDNIYMISPDGNTVRVTSSRFGISGFSLSGNEILFSDYSSSGFNVSAAPRNIIIPNLFTYTYKNIPPVTAPVELNPEFFVDTTKFVVKPYRKALHLFRFHSWLPLYVDVNSIEAGDPYINPGVTLLSQNNLSTLISTIGYEYAGGDHYFHSGIEWRGWYPVIEADLTYGGHQTIIKDASSTPDPTDIKADMIANVSVYDQFWFAYSKFRQLFMPAIYMNYRNTYSYITDDHEYDKDILRLTERIYFSNTFRMAYRDIYPRWGQVIDARLTSAPWDKDILGVQRYITGVLFTPGIARNHSLIFKAGYEEQSDFHGKVAYANRLGYARGYDENIVSEKMTSFSADYTLPLFYPDFAAASILYLKRIRGSLFVDGTRAWGTYNYSTRITTPGATDFVSFGGELLADFFVLRFPFEISGGASVGYIPAKGKMFAVPTVSVNIYGTTLGRKH